MEKQYGTHKQRRWEDVYNHPGTGGTRSSGPCCYGCQHMSTEYTQNPIDSYANQHLCHTHKHREEILTGIEFREQADDYYWSPCEYNFKVYSSKIMQLVFRLLNMQTSSYSVCFSFLINLFFPLSLSFLHLIIGFEPFSHFKN